MKCAYLKMLSSALSIKMWEDLHHHLEMTTYGNNCEVPGWAEAQREGTQGPVGDIWGQEWEACLPRQANQSFQEKGIGWVILKTIFILQIFGFDSSPTYNLALISKCSKRRKILILRRQELFLNSVSLRDPVAGQAPWWMEAESTTME